MKGLLKMFIPIAMLIGCADDLPVPPSSLQESAAAMPTYRIGPLDVIDVRVWRSPEFSGEIKVRPDGRISAPLLGDMVAAGKTPEELASDIQIGLRQFVIEPTVTVAVKTPGGPFEQQIRVVGEAAKPSALPYRANMTLLDVMIEVGGLTQFASGNRAVLARGAGKEKKLYGVKLDSLLLDGDITANTPVLPGDVLIIPKRYF